MKCTKFSNEWPITNQRISVLTILLVLTSIYFIPYNLLFKEFPTLCIHKRLLGFDCPSCGITRALYLLLHFNFSKACYFNSAVFILFPLLVTEIIIGFKFSKILYIINKGLYVTFCLMLAIIYTMRVTNHLSNL
jgi:Protein of unknown function (DUF2752)